MDGAAAVDRAERGDGDGSSDDVEGSGLAEVEELVPTEAGVPLAAVGVEDPEGRPTTRRAGAVAGHDDLGRLPDDVPPEADPGLPSQLEADPRPLPDRRRHRGRQARRLEDEERDPRPPGQGRQPAEPFREPGGPRRPRREVDDEEVHGPAGQERARDRETLLRVCRGDDDEPLRTDAAGHGLDRVEGVGEVQPGNDRAGRLGLRGEPEGERRPPAREITPEREARPAGQAARAEDRVEVPEPGREDAGRIREAGPSRRAEGGIPLGLEVRLGRRRHREGPDDLARGARRGRPPARSEGREGCRHVRGKGRHRMSSIEHLFE